jgi:hypothetical protein
MPRPFAKVFILVGLLSTALIARSAAPPAEVAAPVKAAVQLFFDRVAKGQAKDNEQLFLNNDVPITGFEVRRPNDRPYFQKSPAEMLKRFGSQPKYFVVDRIDVDRIHDRLAVARVEWKTGGARGHSIITWHNDGQSWRIVGFFQDEHFVW